MNIKVRELAQTVSILASTGILVDWYYRTVVRPGKLSNLRSETFVSKEEKEAFDSLLKESSVSDKVFNAESVDLHYFAPQRFISQPKGIRTEAVQVTTENIGKLSLEFEEELLYDASGLAYFIFPAERHSDPTDVTDLYVRPSDWLLPLRGELHVIRNYIFETTFEPDGGQHRVSGELSVADAAIKSLDPALRSLAQRSGELLRDAPPIPSNE